MVTSNYNIGELFIDNGYVTLSETLNDYPKLTVVEYSDTDPGVSTGSGYSQFGMSFVLEGISIDECPIPGFEKQITYNYIHVSKRVLEYPINTYDFVQAKKGSAVKRKGDTLEFSIGSLIGWAAGKVGGSVAAPSFTVELSKNPSPEEYVTVKQYVDEHNQMKGFVYMFSGAGAVCVPVGSGGVINGTIVSNFTLAKNAVPTYRHTALSWSKKQDYDDNPLAKKIYRKLDSNEYVLYDGSYKPHLPPGEDGTDGILPRDLSIMVDNSGFTKNCKITKYKWGQPDVEISAVFGYANCALELVEDPEKPNAETNGVLAALSENVIDAGNAYQEVLSAIKTGKYGYPDDVEWANEPVWRLISIKETKYVYEPLKLNMSPVLKKEDGTLEPVTVPDDFKKFLFTNMELLVREESYGWELKRFAQEDPGAWSQGSIATWLALKTTIALKDKLQGGDAKSKQLYNWMLYSAKVNLEQYLYRRIPLWERITYAVAPYSKFYKDLDEVDWEVQYVSKASLGQDDGDDTPVPVLFPDPNWSPALMLVARGRYKSSFGVSGNPQYNPFTRNYYGSNPVTLTTGSEEYEVTRYAVLPSKNTKPAVTELHSQYAHLEDVIGSMKDGMELEGTMFKEHDYMTVGDYGVIGVETPDVSPDKVMGKYPSSNRDRDDQYITSTSLRVAQDQSFKSHITTENFVVGDGRPPNATLRKPVYEEQKQEDESPYKNSATYVTSSLSNGGIDIVSSVSVPGAKNIQEAVEGAKNQLMMSILTSGSSASAQLLWSTIQRSLINSRISLPKGNWVIKSCTQTVQVSNNVCFPQPIQIEAGNHVIPGVSSKTIQIANENDKQQSVKVLLNANLPLELGSPVEDIPENFSRWLK